MRSSSGRWFLAGTCAVLFLASAGGAANATSTASGAQLKPHRLVLSNDLIQAFAQDGNTVVWINSLGDLYRVRARNVSTGKSFVLGDANDYRAKLRPPALAIAGTRVFWTTCWFGTRLYIDGHTTTLAERNMRPQPKPVLLFELAQGSEDGADDYFAGAAGDGSTLVYGWTHVRPSGEPPAVERVVDGGGVVRVQGPFRTQFPPVAPPITNLPVPAPMYSNDGRQQLARQVAVSQGRVAALPPSSSVGRNSWAFPRPAADGPVVVSTRGGAVISRVAPAGTVGGIALAWPNLAVLVQRHDGAKAVEVYDAGNGRRKSATAVPADASDLAIGTGGVVYRVGRSIYTIGAGGPRLLWRAQVTPIGLSVEGHRVAWAANVGGRGRIVALTLP